ncbi:MAG: hypothetical protein KGD63_14675 [Candidatus Lokiarchaeota archaeon]|nr:hypothetical protein [Candidatus Lokiarchaeota archaeon]
MTKMSLVKAFIDKSYKDSLLMELANEKIIHIKQNRPENLSKKKEQEKENQIKEIHKHEQEIDIFQNNLLELFKKLNLGSLDFQKLNIEKEKREIFIVRDFYELIHHLNEELNFYMNRVNELERYIMKATIELDNINLINMAYKFLSNFNLNRATLKYLNNLDLKVYSTFSKNISSLKELLQSQELPSVYQYEKISKDRIVFFIIFPKILKNDIKERMNIVHAEEIPILKKYINQDIINLERIKKETNYLSKTLGKYQNELERLRNENILKFAALNEVIENLKEYNWAENQFIEVSPKKLMIEFFIPSAYLKKIKFDLDNKYQSKIILDAQIIKKEEPKPIILKEQKNKIVSFQSEKEDSKTNHKDLRKDTPTMVKHNKIIKPFETLTRMYGVPSYSEIDPTPLLFITFPLLFGIMFGDLGHGLVLIIAGLIGGIFIKKHNSIRNISWIIFYCGIWACLFGLLYGEFFGYEQILGFHLEPIPIYIPFMGWIQLYHPLTNVLTIFKLTILIGVFHINLGWIIQFFNLLIQKKKYKAFTETIMKILFLDFGIFLVFAYGLDLDIWLSEPYPILLPIIPALLLILFKPVGKLIRISYMQKESYGSLIGEGSIDTFETLLSVPSNVLSYIRLLALALAHISLMIAIKAMSEIIGGEGILVQILITVGLIFGNIIVILLEGVIVFLNTLRLHFYEFFFKFFQGTGIDYNPFILEENFSNIIFNPEMIKDVISEEIEKEIETQKAKEIINEAKIYISKKYLK